MKHFIQQHAKHILGVLSGFDRMRFRGTLRWLAYPEGMRGFLNHMGVLLKDFRGYVQEVTEQVRQSTKQWAESQDRPLIYLNSAKSSKEEQARQIAERDQVREGLICVFSAVESGYSYEVHRNSQTRRLELQGRNGKCLHYYFYHQHPQFGFMYWRLQTWFPLTIHVGLNGREWLAHQLDAAGLGYRRADNCFLELEDIPRTQQLCDQQLKTPWLTVLNELLQQFHPTHAARFGHLPLNYYWSLDQSEWATDVMFRSREALAELQGQLLRHAFFDFSSVEVMKFLGRKTPQHGGVNGHFQGEVISDVGRRADHLRVKHRLNHNSLKMYDKGSILRVETTINQPQDMKTFRRPEGKPDEKPTWQPLRKGVADFQRRAEISQAANERYLDSLAAVHATQSLGELTKSICQPTQWNGKRVRALQPWSEADAHLLATVNRLEFNLNGFRNRDLRPLLFGSAETTPEETRRQSAKVSRQLRMLRAHGLIKKVPHTHRYQLTSAGRVILTALQAARQANPEQLAQLAA